MLLLLPPPRAAMKEIGSLVAEYGSLAKERRCGLEKRYKEAITFMRNHGMMTLGQNGALYLTSSATIATVDLSDPVPVSSLHCENESGWTIYETRLQLIKQGWTMTEDARQCSVTHYVMLRKQCLEFFSILLRRKPEVEKLTATSAFSHSQGARYYNCVLEVCKKNPFAGRSSCRFSH